MRRAATLRSWMVTSFWPMKRLISPVRAFFTRATRCSPARKIVLGRDVGRLRRLGARHGVAPHLRSNRDARRDCGHRGGRAGLLEEHSPTDFFHYSSLRVFRLSVVLSISDEIVVKNLCRPDSSPKGGSVTRIRSASNVTRGERRDWRNYRDAMAKLIYSTNTSLDGYIEDEDGDFGWGVPEPELFAFINELERNTGTSLYGRRMYETMVYWETRRLVRVTTRPSNATLRRSGAPRTRSSIPRRWITCPVRGRRIERCLHPRTRCGS